MLYTGRMNSCMAKGVAWGIFGGFLVPLPIIATVGLLLLLAYLLYGTRITNGPFLPYTLRQRRHHFSRTLKPNGSLWL